MLRSIAIIPARGGSKGVLRKNVRSLGGIPLVSHTIRAALTSGVFDVVVVSTEDAEIADIARREGCAVLQRPAELAADTALTEPVMEHALSAIESAGGELFDYVWLLQPTSPLRFAADIEGAAQALAQDGVDAVISVTADHSFLWTGVAGVCGRIEPDYDLSARPRRQDRPPVWRENGAIYAVRRELWNRSGVRVAGMIAGYEMPADRSLEIDTDADWRIAEAALARLQGRSVARRLLARVSAIAFDFDGVMTDNTVMVSENGMESVLCDRSDGWGIASLRDKGLPMIVISTEQNPVVSARCAKLRIDCLQGVSDKPAALRRWLLQTGIRLDECAFVGNDENDLECLRMAGLAVVPADAQRVAIEVADIVLTRTGGSGAVRELCDMVAAQLDENPVNRDKLEGPS